MKVVFGRVSLSDELMDVGQDRVGSAHTTTNQTELKTESIICKSMKKQTEMETVENKKQTKEGKLNYFSPKGAQNGQNKKYCRWKNLHLMHQ